MDMKNGKGSCGLGQAPVKPDVKLWMSDQLFHQLFSGQIESMTAFATQKLKLRGDITKALKLDKILAKIRGSGYFILPKNSKFWELENENKLKIYTSEEKTFPITVF